MKKIFARQLPVEYVKSPFDYDDYYNSILVEGNRNIAERIPEELKNAVTVLESGELAEALEDIAKTGACYFLPYCRNATEAIKDYLPELFADGKRPSTRKIGRIKKAVVYYAEGMITKAEALTELTGRRYESATIRGCCQSDWAEVIYPAEDYPNGLKYFEADFFGLYEEYEVHDGENAPDGPEDICGYTMRVYDDPAEEIAAEAGCKPDEVQIYSFSGYRKIATWEAA